MMVKFQVENLFTLDKNNTEIEGRFPDNASQYLSFEIIDKIDEDSNFDDAEILLYQKNNLNDKYKQIPNPLDSTKNVIFNSNNLNELRAEKCSRLEYFKFSLQNATNNTRLFLRVLFW